MVLLAAAAAIGGRRGASALRWYPAPVGVRSRSPIAWRRGVTTSAQLRAGGGDRGASSGGARRWSQRGSRVAVAALSGSAAAAAAGNEEATVRVVTYNVLSSSLCEPSWFARCRAEDLTPATRLERVLGLLETELAASPRTVVCLQEVSRDWSGPLQAWFSRRGYHVHTSLYGHKRNGYMGVALAWPASRFEAVRLEVVRPADRVLMAPAPRPEPTTLSRLAKAWRVLLDSGPPPRPFEVWSEVARRENTLIAAEFETTRGERFCVGCYHMPCLFGSLDKERVMIVHAALAAEVVQTFARGAPYLLAGDFNIKPGDAAYHLLTSGDLDEPRAEYRPPDNPRLPDRARPFRASLREPLQSAYAAKLGAEPDFTNFAFTSNSKTDDAFIETLDYIFCKPHSWTVLRVKPLPAKAHVDLAKPYPDARNPSDHLLLAADLRLSGGAGGAPP